MNFNFREVQRQVPSVPAFKGCDMGSSSTLTGATRSVSVIEGVQGLVLGFELGLRVYRTLGVWRV